jgi:hypothetical protein
MFDWQNIIALTLVGLATGYLVRKIWQRIVSRTEGGCGSCSQCGTAPLVQIESQYDGAHAPTDHATR